MAKVAGTTTNLYALLSDDAAEPTSTASVKPVKKDAPKKAAATEAAATGPVALTPAEKAKLREANKPKAAAPKPQQDRAPRRDPAPVDERAAGPRGTGNRGARRAVNAEPHGHQAPARGRDHDRQSAGKFSRNPPAKKGGAGKGNWGDNVKDSVVDQETAAAVDGWNGEKPAVATKEGEEKEETTVDAEPAAPAEPEEVQLSLDDYLKKREEAAAALAAKIGVVQPRKLENVDLKGAVESKRAADAAAAPAAAPAAAAAPASRKGTKAVNVADVLAVRLPPVGGDRDGAPRGRGRGGRGGRGGDRAPRGDRPPRAEGERPPRAEGERPPRAEGERPQRGGRGGQRGGQGGNRGRPIDTANNRQFPSLGQ